MCEPNETTPSPCSFPVAIDSSLKEARLGVCHGASPRELVVATPSRFHVGDDVDLTLHLATDDEEHVTGRVVAARAYEGDGPFCRLLTIRVERVPDRAIGHRFLGP